MSVKTIFLVCALVSFGLGAFKAWIVPAARIDFLCLGLLFSGLYLWV